MTKVLKGIIVFLAIVSFVFYCGCVKITISGFFHAGSPDAPLDSLIISYIIMFAPIVVPIFSLYFLKVKNNKITEKRRNIYAILFLIFNFLTAISYGFLFLIQSFGSFSW